MLRARIQEYCKKADRGGDEDEEKQQEPKEAEGEKGGGEAGAGTRRGGETDTGEALQPGAKDAGEGKGDGGFEWKEEHLKFLDPGWEVEGRLGREYTINYGDNRPSPTAHHAFVHPKHREWRGWGATPECENDERLDDVTGTDRAAVWGQLAQTNPTLSILGVPPLEFDRVIKLAYKGRVCPRALWANVVLPWNLEGLDELRRETMTSFREFRRKKAAEPTIDTEYFTEASKWTEEQEDRWSNEGAESDSMSLSLSEGENKIEKPQKVKARRPIITSFH